MNSVLLKIFIMQLFCAYIKKMQKSFEFLVLFWLGNLRLVLLAVLCSMFAIFKVRREQEIKLLWMFIRVTVYFRYSYSFHTLLRL